MHILGVLPQDAGVSAMDAVCVVSVRPIETGIGDASDNQNTVSSGTVSSTVSGSNSPSQMLKPTQSAKPDSFLEFRPAARPTFKEMFGIVTHVGDDGVIHVQDVGNGE